MASLSLLSSNHFLPHFAPIKLHYQKTLACSVKKPRGSRKGKSNTELCNDIRKFLSEVNLPEDTVPSIKQLSNHGRQDLAHIVRRRGYKVIGEILAASTMSVIDEGLSVMQEQVEDKPTGQNKKMKDHINGKETETMLKSNDQIFVSQDTSLYSSMQEKAAKFIQDGQLDTNEDTESESRNLVGPITNMSSELENLIIDVIDDEDLEVEADINRLKFMLHQKELELTLLKQEIEKEKIALSAMQELAESEITKAHVLISEKDAELHAAEETLSELKEVEIEFFGDGENVEVSGSFNGWHQTIKMDLIDTSLWRASLWLYPGVYEIKFVVDGEWKIDPERESIVNGSMVNNILRVDR